MIYIIAHMRRTCKDFGTIKHLVFGFKLLPSKDFFSFLLKRISYILVTEGLLIYYFITK